MAIRHKRKSTANYDWQSADLVSGQIGINLINGTLHTKNANNEIVTIGHYPAIQLLETPISTPISIKDTNVVRIALNGSIPTLDFTGGLPGQKIILELLQDSVGNRTVGFGTSIRFGTDITGITLTTTAYKKDRIGLIYDADAGKYDVIAFAKGF